jgi:hypothetical protein
MPKLHSTVMQVEPDDDLQMAWLWIAHGWKGVRIQAGVHSQSWMVWK